ncbi:la-related protein 1C-like [Prosopis cineraria]|uniref:la-related protein 1C-like n=1 Tax=Prosopis cineraria TaxID=364024 RepID=UPI00240EF24E|nr:la-related protein 1C-like [Prosopis cineraria]XP_054795950.1 la-related protein 1C-like [Prosopis cineraria]
MVTAPDSSSNHHSPTSTGDTNSPKFPRKNLPSPWAQVVRGGESESLSSIRQSPPSSSSAFSSSSSLSSLITSVFDHPSASDSNPKVAPRSPPLDNSNTAAADISDASNGNAARSKKTAWNKLANGDVEVSPVMGAVSWPALSESTKAPAKLPAESSSKASTDGLLPSSQEPVTSHTPHKQAASNAKPNFATNHSTYNRQRTMMKRGSGSNIGAGPAQNSFPNPPQPPPPPPFPVLQIPPSNYNTVVPGAPDPSSRELLYKKNSWDPRPPVGGFMPVVNDHRNSTRRGNFGPHSRIDGSYHNNYGGRRDQDRGNYANSRDAHVNQQRMPPRGLVRHLPPNTAAFVAPQPVAPFANTVGFPEYYYFPTLPLEPFRGMPFFTHSPPSAMFFPVAESPLANMIVNQIDYYFSDANLVKDEYLRSNMDEQGWVSISLIASFPRVKSLTSNIQLILDSLRTSTIVEVQGDKLRRRNEWKTWLPSSQAQLRVDSALASPGGSNHNSLVGDFQKITLEESTTD